jgi:GxxExxY protein
MLRIASSLSDDLEKLAHDVIGSCLAVHRELGPGLLEAIYTRAVGIELTARGIPFEAEKPVPVHYRGRPLCHQRLDLFIDKRLVLEIKSVDVFHPIHRAQVISYLRVTGARLGLLVNFNVPVLKHGIRRVAL